jgi:WD40 repeat protein
MKLRLVLALSSVLASLLLESNAPARARGEADLPDLETGSSEAIRAVAFAPDGQLVVAGGDAREVLAFEVVSGKRRWTYTAPGRGRALAVSPDGRQVAVGWAGSELHLLESTSGKLLRKAGPLTGWPSQVLYSPKGDRIAAAGQAQTVTVLDPTTGLRRSVLSGAISWLNGIAFSADGRRLAAAGWDHSVRIWDLDSGSLWRSFFEHKFAVNAVIFTRDGTAVLSSSDDQTLVSMNAGGGYLVRRARGPSLGPLAQAAASDVIASGAWNGRVVLLREATLYPYKVLPAHRGTVHAVAVAPGGRIGVSGGADGKVKLWKAR